MLERLPRDLCIKAYTYLYIFIYANIYLYLLLSVAEKVFTELSERIYSAVYNLICSFNLTNLYENRAASE